MNESGAQGILGAAFVLTLSSANCESIALESIAPHPMAKRAKRG